MFYFDPYNHYLICVKCNSFFFSGGGTGFVGKYLKQYLKNHNYDVTIISRKSIKSESVLSWVIKNKNFNFKFIMIIFYLFLFLLGPS